MQQPTGAKSTYEEWMRQEGLPITEALGGIEDLTEVPRGPWARLGGYGGYIQLRGTFEAARGVYVGEIPPGKALEPEKHLYEEVIYILRGRGLTEVWVQGQSKQTFEWGEGSLFAAPLNTWHRLVNGGREPVLFLGVTTAPEVMDTFHDIDFVFSSDYVFKNRYSAQADYFNPTEKRYRLGLRNIWETNFIPDVRTAMLEDTVKVAGGQTTQFEMAGNNLVGHINQWPVGRYHKAHYHGPGAVLVGLRAKGYVLLWPKELGIHPYQDGYEDQVVVVTWKPNSFYGPPDGWYHQHFNVSNEPARLLAIRYGSRIYLSSDASQRKRRFYRGEDPVLTAMREGGWLIEYEDEDPEIRRRFEEALRREGIESTMPPVVYRT